MRDQRDSTDAAQTEATHTVGGCGDLAVGGADFTRRVPSELAWTGLSTRSSFQLKRAFLLQTIKIREIRGESPRLDRSLHKDLSPTLSPFQPLSQRTLTSVDAAHIRSVVMLRRNPRAQVRKSAAEIHASDLRRQDENGSLQRRLEGGVAASSVVGASSLGLSSA
ncbi:hypothetical protein ACSDR0_50015, partial [Streptosporangium sp. G11]|uniref:hypothetical protein n=1 Tax=Streptosporangium sp. G11 TaxID=3436926 RepID=UPI003EB91107